MGVVIRFVGVVIRFVGVVMSIADALPLVMGAVTSLMNPVILVIDAVLGLMNSAFLVIDAFVSVTATVKRPSSEAARATEPLMPGVCACGRNMPRLIALLAR